MIARAEVHFAKQTLKCRIRDHVTRWTSAIPGCHPRRRRRFQHHTVTAIANLSDARVTRRKRLRTNRDAVSRRQIPNYHVQDSVVDLDRLVVSLRGDRGAADLIAKLLNERSTFKTNHVGGSVHIVLQQRVHGPIVWCDLIDAFDSFYLGQRIVIDVQIVTRDEMLNRHYAEFKLALVLAEKRVDLSGRLHREFAFAHHLRYGGRWITDADLRGEVLRVVGLLDLRRVAGNLSRDLDVVVEQRQPVRGPVQTPLGQLHGIVETTVYGSRVKLTDERRVVEREKAELAI